MLNVKSGETTTYSDIARRIGRPNSAQAVRSAVGKNNISLVVPCLRVINKASSRINYLRGADIKSALLESERLV